MAEYFGRLTIHPGQRWAIVASRFNQRITDRLISGARDALVRHGAESDTIDVFWVPGAFEIPALAERLTARGYAGIITLGAIIRGQTPHFDYVAANTASGIAAVGRQSPVPVVFGVLTCNTMEEADDRAGGKAGNKGADAALTAMEMADLYRSLADGAGR